MRYLIPFTFLLLLASCKKDNSLSDNDAGRTLVTNFSYVNPKEQVLSDSVIYLPLSGVIRPVDSKYQFYNGAQFVSNTRRENKNGKGYPTYDGVYIKWKVSDLANNAVIKEENSFNFNLYLYQTGTYRLTQYVYSNSDNREKSINPVDSISKMIIANDLLNIDSIAIENFSFGSPYLNWDLDISKPVDALVSIYKNVNSHKKGEEPIFKTQLIKGLGKNTVSLKFGIPQNNAIPNIYKNNEENGDCLIQLNVIQDGKTYTIIDNVWGLIFKYLTKGYFTHDKSKVLNEQTLRFGDMKLKIWTSYKLME